VVLDLVIGVLNKIAEARGWWLTSVIPSYSGGRDQEE
jgi:hypothetical protein